MVLRTVSLPDREGWRERLSGVPHAFGHTWESCHAMSLTSGARTELFFHEEAGGRAVCPFAERTHEGQVDVFTPYGFSGFVAHGETPGLERAWRELVRERGYVAGYVGLHPLLSPPGIFAADRASSNAVFLLDLRRPEDTIRSGLGQNRRRELYRWERAPPRLDHPAEAVRDFVLARFRRCHRERGAAQVYMLSDATLGALLDADNVFSTAAGRGDEVEAVCIFGVTVHEGQYLFNVCTEAGRSLTTGLLWEGVRRLRSMGVPWLNLGGGIRPDPSDGVATYKARFGARRVPLVSLRQVYRPDVYDALCRGAGVAPSAEGYFPAYRRPAHREPPR